MCNNLITALDLMKKNKRGSKVLFVFTPFKKIYPVCFIIVRP